MIIVVGGIFMLSRASRNKPEGIACTMEAKICPDGSYVGRSGPMCEFSKCPDIDPTASWNKFSDTKAGVSFKYPETIPTSYISLVDWPPKVQVLAQAFSCTSAGVETAQAGQTQKMIINDHTYCVTKESEGAAGSTYTNYAYATELQSKLVIFTFSLKTVQCANYDDPKKTECEKERAGFSIDPTVDQIAQSFKLQ